MTRRGALIGTMLMAAGELMRADQETFATPNHVWKPKPPSLVFDFTSRFGMSALILKFPDKTLTITREELQREFEGCTHEAEPWAGGTAPFAVDARNRDRALDVCRKCGVTYWRKP